MSHPPVFSVLLLQTDKARTSSTISLLNGKYTTGSQANAVPLYEVSHLREGKEHTIERARPVYSGSFGQSHQAHQYPNGLFAPGAAHNHWAPATPTQQYPNGFQTPAAAHNHWAPPTPTKQHPNGNLVPAAAPAPWAPQPPPPYCTTEASRAPMNQPYPGTTSTNPPVGTIKFHYTTSKIDCKLHGHDIRLARTDILSMGSHKFCLPPELTNVLGSSFKWQESSLLGSGMELIDANDRKVVEYKKRLKGDKDGGSQRNAKLRKALKYTPLVKHQNGFEIYVPLQGLTEADRQMLLDFIAVTGMAAMEYRRQSNEDWDEVGEEWFGSW